jgi:hypothetical protein
VVPHAVSLTVRRCRDAAPAAISSATHPYQRGVSSGKQVSAPANTGYTPPVKPVDGRLMKYICRAQTFKTKLPADHPGSKPMPKVGVHTAQSHSLPLGRFVLLSAIYPLTALLVLCSSVLFRSRRKSRLRARPSFTTMKGMATACTLLSFPAPRPPLGLYPSTHLRPWRCLESWLLSVRMTSAAQTR